MPERTYTEAEVREILRRAVDRSSEGEGLSRQDLIQAARDVGIQAEVVDAAISELEGEGEISAEIAALRRERRHELASSATTWAIVNTGLFGVDWASGGGWWFYWPLGAWSIALLLRLKGEFFARPAEERKVALKRLEERHRERERKAAAERKRQEQLKREHSRGLEGVVERGVEELLRAAAHRVSGGRVRVEAPPDNREERPADAEPAVQNTARRS